MFGRNIWFIAILVAAVVVPYHLSNDTQWSTMNNWWGSMWTDNATQLEAFDSYRTPWPGQPSTRPTASVTPLPPNYSRRPIENIRPPGTLGRGPGLPTTTVPPMMSAPTSVASSRITRPQYHDWMPVNEMGTSAAISGGGGPPLGKSAGDSTQPGLCGPLVPSFSQLIRFDITPAWVMNNWQRVSTRLAEFDLEGLRVPVVTGTEVDDLVGTMTYYFDRRQTLQRISFDGFTGEPTPLVQVMTDQLAMQAEPWLGAGFYVNRDSAKQLLSVMRITHASVIRASEARRRYTVEFELNHAGSELGLSQQFSSLIESDRNSKALELSAAETKKTAEELETEALLKKLEIDAQATGQLADGSQQSVSQTVPRQGSSTDPLPMDNAVSDTVVQPKPLNGSDSGGGFLGGFFGRVDTSQPAQRLYPSQLPSNWQTSVPPTR